MQIRDAENGSILSIYIKLFIPGFQRCLIIVTYRHSAMYYKTQNVILVSLILLIKLVMMNAENQQKPNIIIIMTDDMGFNDVGFHGSNQIPTPNIDALAYYGIILNRHYSAPVCTPSRGSLMTGKYPTKLGLQYSVIDSDQPHGLQLTHKLLPQYLKDVGYSTHLIGKWHLGFYRKAYTPTMRGFDNHLGIIGPYIDYWDHTLLKVQPDYVLGRGLDMRTNLSVNYETKGIYATDLFTDYAVRTIKEQDKNRPMFLMLSHVAPHCANTYEPLQAPDDEIRKFSYIKDPNRRIYAAMMSRLDTGIGKVIEVLEQENMLNNSIILFLSDNGAPTEGSYSNFGSNAPLRGQKNSPYEGGTRLASFIWSPLLKFQERVSNQLIHITDWLPTFSGLTGFKLTDRNIDGFDIWNALSQNLESPRLDALCNINDVIPFVCYLNGYWKYVNGTSSNGIYDHWLGEFENDNQSVISNMEYIGQLQSTQTAKILTSYRSMVNRGSPINQSEIEIRREQATVHCNRVTNPIPCNPLVSECLFNLKDDPCETNNLALERPDIISLMRTSLKIYFDSMIESMNKPGDPRSNPADFNNTWTWWYDELNINEDGSGIKLYNFKNNLFALGMNALVLVVSRIL